MYSSGNLHIGRLSLWGFRVFGGSLSFVTSNPFAQQKCGVKFGLRHAENQDFGG
jgi:hypothetical protein